MLLKTMKFRPLSIIVLYATSLFGNTSYHAMVGYPRISPGVFPQSLVADAQGNYFIIGYARTASGLPQIHVDKTGANGSALGSIEFGGSNLGIGLGDLVSGAAIDSQGNLVIVGSTSSPDFPQVAPLNTDAKAGGAFVTKIDSQLNNILFSTILGGTQGTTGAAAVTFDSAGDIYVTGATADTNFPVTSGAYQMQPPPAGAAYGFLTEISSNLKSVVFSTYFGDSSVSCLVSASDCPTILAAYTHPSSVALDAMGDVIIAGYTDANKLPITPGVIGPTCGSCGYPASAGFLAKFSPDGSKLLWATYVPVVYAASYNSSGVNINALAIDGSGNIIVGGSTSPGLPVTTGALQTSFPGTGPYNSFGGFVMKLDSAAQEVHFSTYFGGEDASVYGLTTDSSGNVWLTGDAPFDTLPVPAGTTNLGQSYLAALSPDGSSLTTIFTAPYESAGLAITSITNGVTAMGYAGTCLTASPGAGPSLVGIENSGGFSISNAIAPYELVSLVGLGVGPQTSAGTQVLKGVVTNSLEGVQVLFNGIPAPLLSVGPTQINAVVPGEVYASATTTLEIVTPAGTLQGPVIPVNASQPGVFTNSVSGSAAALNQDGSVNSAANPAPLGSIVTVWVSGAGISSAEQSDGAIVTIPGNPTLPVSAFLGGSGFAFSAVIGQLPAGPVSLEVLYAGDAQGMVAGITQVNFRLPAESSLVSPGNLVLSLQVGDAQSPGFIIYTTGPSE
jgi:uncharacterized protein (TIGR03437 family)